MNETTIEAPFDYKNPDYLPIIRERVARLKRLRDQPERLPFLKRYYRDNPAQFITDWGVTSDPRNVEIGLPVQIPFILFPRQREWIDWVLERWRQRQFGVNPKSRELGVSWLAVALSDTLCLFNDDMAVGFGSRKLELVDNGADPKSLFWKARTFLETLPPEFTGNWSARRHSSEGIIRFPTTGSTITGEGGDNIGRGARASLYFVDEAAYLERPESIDASLSQTTNCRIDVSSARGMANPFATKVHSWPAERVFRFHWRDDPRKDDAWYEKQQENLDPVTLAQEVDMDFAASVTGVLIPSAWAAAAVGAAAKLGLTVSGSRDGALDVADEGIDKNAFACSYGLSLEFLEEWSGKGDDIFGTVVRACGIADDHGLTGFRYDADGLGAGVRGDARVINEQRARQGQIAGSLVRPLVITAFRGSGAVLNPDAQDVKGRRNDDFFQNLKAQSWWTLRRRFEATWRAINGKPYDAGLLININPDLPLLGKLLGELSQPTYTLNLSGKIVVDKAPDNTRSPNLADAVMILMGRHKRAMTISDDVKRAA